VPGTAERSAAGGHHGPRLEVTPTSSRRALAPPLEHFERGANAWFLDDTRLIVRRARARRPRAPPFLDPPGYARHRPEATLLYRLVERRYPVLRELRANGRSTAAQARPCGLRSSGSAMTEGRGSGSSAACWRLPRRRRAAGTRRRRLHPSAGTAGWDWGANL
jgi:hypothetical protein